MLWRCFLSYGMCFHDSSGGHSSFPCRVEKTENVRCCKIFLDLVCNFLLLVLFYSHLLYLFSEPRSSWMYAPLFVALSYNPDNQHKIFTLSLLHLVISPMIKVSQGKLQSGSLTPLPEGTVVAVHSGFLFIANFDCVLDPLKVDFWTAG